MLRGSNKINHKEQRHAWHRWIVSIAGALLLSACSTHTPDVPIGPQLSGNWQFNVANPPDQSFVGGLQGGFLIQNNNSLSGNIAFAISVSSALICNSGSAAITGTISGQNISFTAVAGTQTFIFTGSVSTDSSTMIGTYNSTAGTAADGTECGTAQTGLSWSANFVPPLVGAIQGSFHSTGGNSGLMNQQFPVTGLISQAQNTGESSAIVSGTLTFVDPGSLLSVYPCIDTVTVSGRISGNTVRLQLIGSDGSKVGQIGDILPNQQVTFDRFHGGNVLHDVAGMGYAFNTQTCPGTSFVVAGDFGNICLGVGSSTACSQPISLTPATLMFPPQAPGVASSLPFYVMNSTQSTLSGITVTLENTSTPANSFAIVGATCDVPGDPVAVPVPLPEPNEPFDLLAGQTCTFPVSFTSSAGAAVNAILTVTSPASVDNNKVFAVPISGTASSAASLKPKDIVQVACVQWPCSLDEADCQRDLVRRDKWAIASKAVLW